MIVIDSEGIELNGLRVLPFVLRQGEYLALDFPRIYDPQVELQLVTILTGKVEVSTLKVLQPVTFVSPNFNHSLLDKMVRSNKVSKVLERKFNLTNSEVKIFIEGLGIDANTNFFQLGLIDRFMIQLEIAYRQTNHIIVNSLGLDYNGLVKLKQRIAKELYHGTVIELNYPSTRGRDHLFNSSDGVHCQYIDVVT